MEPTGSWKGQQSTKTVEEVTAADGYKGGGYDGGEVFVMFKVQAVHLW